MDTMVQSYERLALCQYDNTQSKNYVKNSLNSEGIVVATTYGQLGTSKNVEAESNPTSILYIVHKDFVFLNN